MPRKVICILTGSIFLIWMAIYNQYPLVFSDTGSYITGEELRRAIGYHYFINITSLHFSLWFTIFSQSLITSALLIRITSVIFKNTKFNDLIAFLILFLIILLTDISTYTSCLIPDVFTSWLFLSFILLISSTKWYDKLLGKISIWLALFCHGSNIIIAILSLFILLPTSSLYKNYGLLFKESLI